MGNRIILVILVSLLLAGCARTSSMMMSKDVVQITVNAPPVCGAEGAQKVATRRAAIETLKNGFDEYLIINSNYQSSSAVVGYTPTQSYTTGSATVTGYGNTATGYGQSNTTTTGGFPIIASKHDQVVIVKMFHSGDPAGSNALSARSILGPKWQEALKEEGRTPC